MSGAPRKPSGPPPTVQGKPSQLMQSGVEIRGVNEIKGIHTAPPVNAAALKPPPMAPPPRALLQTIQRPPIEVIKGIETPRGLPPRPASSSMSPAPVAPGRGPPRPMGSPASPPPFIPDHVVKSPDIASIAPPKSSDANPVSTPAARKAGAISMFDTPPTQSQEPADKKPKLEGPLPSTVPKPGPPPKPQDITMDPTQPMVRIPRPLPPRPQPPGIPEGQPLPPGSKPFKETPPPASVRPAPDRGRAPPKDEPVNKITTEAPSAPLDTEPPTKKGKKVIVKEEIYVKRRERDQPEFEESSSSDEEMDKVTGEPKRAFVKQPKKPDLINADDILSGKIQREAQEKLIAEEQAAKKKETDKIAAAEEAMRAKKAAALDVKKVTAASSNSQKTAVAVASASTSSKVEKESKEAKSVTIADSAKEKKFDPFDEENEIESINTEDMIQAPIGIPPAMVMKEATQSSFVPAPPVAYDVYVDNSDLGKTLPRGRLIFRCIEGLDIRLKGETGKNARCDPFIKFKLGVAERHPWKQTKVKRKQTSNPKFDDEIVSFDIIEPSQYVFKDDVQIMIEIMHKGTLKDELIGSVSMSVLRFFSAPYVGFEEKVPLFLPGAKNIMKVSLEIMFQEARTGIFQVTLFDAQNLRNIDPMGKQNPYVQLSLGDFYKKKSKTIQNGGTEPYFEEEDILMWADQLNWHYPLAVNVLDQLVGIDKPIGQTEISLLPYMNIKSDNAVEDVYDLFYKVPIDPSDDRQGMKDIPSGEIRMRVRFYPAGKLIVHIKEAKGLLFPENFVGDETRMDPYTNITVEGKAIKSIQRTPADKDGGGTPVWNTDINFEIVDQYMIDVEVMNQGSISGGHAEDTLLGTIQISLLTVFRNGDTSQWWTLKQRKANGGVREVGNIFVHLKFAGPSGVSFPQFRPEIDSFDDSIRAPVKQESKKDSDDIVEKPLIDTIPDHTVKEVYEKPKVPVGETGPPPEFNDDEIVAAFKFIDLDHNNYVGAAEIRHILVCMGELVTDEEIDCMISMVDLDGDGQVSFAEFKSLVLHPNPGVIDMITEVALEREAAIQDDKNMTTGKVKGTDLSSFQRQKEMTLREAKKKMLMTFAYDNQITFQSIQASHREFLALPKTKRVGGRIKFDEFVKVMFVDPIQEYRKLHAMFDSEELGDLDFKEFILSLLNFITVDREQRIRFSFKMMDEDMSDYISQREVEEILRGNHMIGLASVKRKAETVMRQALTAKAGRISENEFVVVSKKFPNILMPQILASK